MPLMQLIYASTAVREYSDEELAVLLEDSMRCNGEDGITGMLLYARGTFLQALEGRESAVDETYRRIALDKRHRDLVITERAPILRRSFGDWTMGFRRCDTPDAAAVPGFTKIMESGFRATELIQDPNFAKSILHKFALGRPIPATA